MEVRKFIIDKTEENLKNGRSMKATTRGLGIGRHQLFALKEANGSVMNNMEVINVYKILQRSGWAGRWWEGKYFPELGSF